MAFGLYQRALVLRTDQHGRITIKADENGHHQAYVERNTTPHPAAAQQTKAESSID